MKIAVFGMGYVGVVTAACFAEDGHKVVGVDVSPAKLDQLRAGESPIVEDGIAELVARSVASGRLSATDRAAEALDGADLAIICVGTPSKIDGSLNQRYIENVCEEIGGCLRSEGGPVLLVFRSTMVPGSMRSLVLPTLEQAAGFPPGGRYRVVFHPEFLREGTSIADFKAPPKIVVGEACPGDGELLWQLYPEKYQAPRITCPVEVAEMVKYCDNLFHALKITFANEVGQFCHAHGINSQEVMRIFCEDRKLNIAPSYLKPGFAFGGSCLPKDLRAFLAVARERAISLPMLEGVLPSNRHQIERVLQMALATGARSIGFHGLAFKPGTDDLRESPYVELAERLLGKGRSLTFFDEHVHVARLTGGNQSYIAEVLPHLAEMLTSDVAKIEDCDLILICHKAGEAIIDRWRSLGVNLLDLTGAFSANAYHGIDCVV
jgi:GDP-mannose 6-dehydrogenase